MASNLVSNLSESPRVDCVFAANHGASQVRLINPIVDP